MQLKYKQQLCNKNIAHKYANCEQQKKNVFIEMLSFKTGILKKSIVILTIDNGGAMVIKFIFKWSNFHFVKAFLSSVFGPSPTPS